MMKAIIYNTYGSPDVLELKELKLPVPKNNEVLIRVHSTTVTAGDIKARKADPFFLRFMLGLTKPKVNILGYEFAGEIESVGATVKSYQKGDHVFGVKNEGGANAEYMCLPEDGVVTMKPSNMSHNEAAAMSSGAIVTMQALKKENIRSGQKVLVYGASGSLGTYAVQFAKYFGAEVTGVCSTSNIEMVKSIGADKVIDYTSEDFTEGNDTYDLVLDAVGKSSFSESKKVLNANGVYLSSWPTPRLFLQVLRTKLIGRKKAKLMSEFPNLKSLKLLREIIETGKIKPVIDRSYPLERLAEAHRYVEKGHKKGNVVITL